MWGLLIVDLSGTIKDGNPVFRELAGSGVEDLSSLSYSKLFEDGDQSSASEEIQRLMAGGSTAEEGVRTLLVKSGETRVVNKLSILIRNRDGEPDHVLVTMQVSAPG